jgi:hypothetical protein
MWNYLTYSNNHLARCTVPSGVPACASLKPDCAPCQPETTKELSGFFKYVNTGETYKMESTIFDMNCACSKLGCRNWSYWSGSY